MFQMVRFRQFLNHKNQKLKRDNTIH